jgi:hypothetical protein
MSVMSKGCINKLPVMIFNIAHLYCFKLVEEGLLLNLRHSLITLSVDAMTLVNLLKVFAQNNGFNFDIVSPHWRYFSCSSVCFADGKTIRSKIMGLYDYKSDDLINKVRNNPSKIYLNKLCTKLPKSIY